MDQLFAHLTLTDVHTNVIRNIVSIEVSQDLFDDLSNSPQEWALAQQVEDEVKPPPYQSRTPVIHRPFEDAQWFNAIGWPFKHWQASRFSDGTFGVWYGCDTVETSVYETAYHWFSGFLTDYGVAQSVGARLHREGHPGLVTASVRRATGEIYAVLNPNVLSNPRQHSQLSYRLDARHIVIEKKPGVA